MEREISANNFLEYGEHNGNLYGTHLDSIRDIIKQGKKKEIDDLILLFLIKSAISLRQND